MLELSRCRKGIDTARFITEATKEVLFKQHLEGICTEKECRQLVTYRIIAEKCRMCGTCQDICKDNAIIGERKNPSFPSYQPFQIVQSRCRSGCHECLKVCPTKAIAVINTLLPSEKATLSQITRELEELLHLKSEVEGLGYLPLEIIQARCTRCDECIKVCPSGAIEVESLGYVPFEIIEKRCTRCGDCLRVCPSGAIEAGYKSQLMVGV
jgi:ferredoxin